MSYVADNANFSVRDLVSAHILDKIEQVQAVSADASKEYSLEKALDKMFADWQPLEFVLMEYRDTGTMIVGGIEEIQVMSHLNAALKPWTRITLATPLPHR